MEALLFVVIAALWALLLAVGGALFVRIVTKLDAVSDSLSELREGFAALKAVVERT